MSASAAAQVWGHAVDAGDTGRACALMSDRRACAKTVADLQGTGLRFTGEAVNGMVRAPGERYYSFASDRGTVFVTVTPKERSFDVRVEVTVVS